MNQAIIGGSLGVLERGSKVSSMTLCLPLAYLIFTDSVWELTCPTSTFSRHVTASDIQLPMTQTVFNKSPESNYTGDKGISKHQKTIRNVSHIP